jgi:hypothetical protein
MPHLSLSHSSDQHSHIAGETEPEPKCDYGVSSLMICVVLYLLRSIWALVVVSPRIRGAHLDLACGLVRTHGLVINDVLHP